MAEEEGPAELRDCGWSEKLPDAIAPADVDATTERAGEEGDEPSRLLLPDPDDEDGAFSRPSAIPGMAGKAAMSDSTSMSSPSDIRRAERSMMDRRERRSERVVSSCSCAEEWAV